MDKPDNYARQARQAQQRFLQYDQQALIRKLNLDHDADALYPRLLGETYRLDRTTGDLRRRTDGGWADANSFDEIMTLLDLICDSREDRFLTGKWKNMASFGMMFHQNLLELTKDLWAEKIQAAPDCFRRACLALGSRELPLGDIGYAIELFDGLEIALQFWFADEDFPASLRFSWDENANMYLKYETMFYARGLLLHRLDALMAAPSH